MPENSGVLFFLSILHLSATSASVHQNLQYCIVIFSFQTVYNSHLSGLIYVEMN